MLIWLSTSFPALLVSLLLAGLAGGTALLPAYSLLSEISLVRLRGSLASLNTLTGNLGWLCGLLAPLLLPLPLLPLLLVSPSLLLLLAAPLLPRSPVWLVRRGREEEARTVLHHLRGPHCNI